MPFILSGGSKGKRKKNRINRYVNGEAEKKHWGE
jgi:Uri superfamily endonuclease